MKKSQFKILLREALEEVLPEVLGDLLAEAVTDPGPRPLLKIHKDSGGSYDDIGGISTSAPAIKTESAEIAGEKYVSGKGIMEWFSNRTPSLETEKKSSDVRSYVEDVMRRSNANQ